MRKLFIPLLATVSLLGLSTASIAAPVAKATTPSQTANSPLQQNLLALIQTGKQLQSEARIKQNTMTAQFKTKAEQAKTPAQQQALQKEFLNDIIAFKTAQSQKLASLNLTEPRVKAVRDNMILSLNSDIKATKIVLANPTPTPATKQAFETEVKAMQQAHQQANTQLTNLMREAGLQPPSATTAKK